METTVDAPTSSQQAEDPLVAALPPNTDYITYLTLLEYQLTPQNLPTLNALLQADNGTLAAEIGWDLLKLVLPMLQVEPIAAQECLDIIARRGNPREVIVRVAEELERLGQDDVHDGDETEEDGDGLLTFAGEAPRVHLGEMTLDGMPQSKDTPAPEDKGPATSRDVEVHVPGQADEETVLQALLFMLGQLHPRIKTQYPSRFLATSLPAALGAYRRLSMRANTTEAFLDTLTTLGGRKRPTLPPRTSTSSVVQTPVGEPSNPMIAVSAPLPDPEGKSSSTTTAQDQSTNETAINQRLLQAVLLEIIDERTTTSTDAQPPMTTHLRALIEPQTLTSVRKTELSSTASTIEARDAEAVRTKFLTTASSISLDILSALQSLDSPDAEREEADSEYPTSPSQIPFSITGLLLLLAIQQYTSTLANKGSLAFSNMNANTLLPHIATSYSSPHLKSSPPAIDALLSLLYTIFAVSPTTTEPSDTAARLELIPKMSIYTLLRDVFVTCPDGDLRDNAHHIASHLVHGYMARDVRIDLLRDLLNGQGARGLYEGMQGKLREIGVQWLREEIWPTEASARMMAKVDEAERGFGVEVLGDAGEVNGLGKLIWDETRVPSVPGVEGAEEGGAAVFSGEVGYYIGAMNLLGLFAKWFGEHCADSEGGERDKVESVGMDTVLKKGEAMLRELEGWTAHLNKKLAERTRGSSEVDVDGILLSDFFALEDAVGRAREILHHGSD